MAGMLARMFSPLRHIDADPDELVLAADDLLRRSDKALLDAPHNSHLWPAVSAYANAAAAKIQLAQYLKEHHD